MDDAFNEMSSTSSIITLPHGHSQFLYIVKQTLYNINMQVYTENVAVLD